VVTTAGRPPPLTTSDGTGGNATGDSVTLCESVKGKYPVETHPLVIKKGKTEAQHNTIRSGTNIVRAEDMVGKDLGHGSAVVAGRKEGGKHEGGEALHYE